MPTYEYLCDDCGTFEAIRPMSRSSESVDCPACGAPAPRCIASAPACPSLSPELRTAHATNERSRHEPTRRRAHAPGCGCCSGASKSSASAATGTPKSFPSKRPWMISH